jgi:anti-sigma B factor antagonist
LQKSPASSNVSGHFIRGSYESQDDLTSLPRRPRERITLKVETGMEIEIRNRGEVKLIKLTGRLTLGDSVDRLRATFDDLAGTGAYCYVVDLKDIAMLDSSGIGLLVQYLTLTKQQGGSLKLLNPSPFAIKTLKMIGLLKLFQVFEDQESAVASFS